MPTGEGGWFRAKAVNFTEAPELHSYLGYRKLIPVMDNKYSVVSIFYSFPTERLGKNKGYRSVVPQNEIRWVLKICYIFQTASPFSVVLLKNRVF